MQGSAIAFLAAAACAKDTPGASEPVSRRPAAAEGASSELLEPCSPHNCGTNSARVNGSVLGAVPLGGTPNLNGFSIEPTLHPREGTAAPALRVDLREGQIVGVDDEGEVIAMGDELKGRWFHLVRRVTGASEQRGKVRIVDVAFVRLMVDRDDARDAAVGYELAFEPESGAAPATELCRQAPLLWPNAVVELAGKAVEQVQRLPHAMKRAAPGKAWSTLKKIAKLPRTVKETVRREQRSFDQPVSLIFGIGDEAYDDISADIRPAPGTLTLACPGSALSKMKLMGYDSQDTTRDQRQAAIKMLTGRYCSAYPFTTDGKPLRWQNRTRSLRWSPQGVVEALWNKDGAICLGRPRDGTYTREQIVAEHCRSLPPCDDSVSWDHIPDGAEFITVSPG